MVLKARPVPSTKVVAGTSVGGENGTAPWRSVATLVPAPPGAYG
jgi:hypothetical protein